MSIAPYVPGLPGVRAAKTATHRIVFKQASEMYLAGGRIIDGSKSRDPLNTGDLTTLRAGLMLGKITASGKYAPSILGTTSNAEAVGSVAIETTAATATELNRRIGSSGTFKLTGPAAASGVVVTETVTYSAVNTETGVITCTALVNAFIAGSLIQPTDGSESMNTFVPDGYGIPVAEGDGTVIDVQDAELPVGGTLVSSQLINWPSDTSLRAWVVSRLNQAAGGKFVFDHVY